MGEKFKLIIELGVYDLKFFWVKTPRIWRARKQLEIVKYDRIPFSKSNCLSEIVKDYLSSCAQVYQYSSYPIPTLLLLPFTKSFLREFKVPPFSGNKLSQTVNYLIEEEVPLPYGDRTYDFVKITDGRVLISAIRRSVLMGMVEEFKKAGLKVIRADFALTGIIRLLDFPEDETVLFIEHNDSNLNFGVFRGYTPEFFKNITAEVEDWEQEIYRQIRYYQTERQYWPIKKIVAVGNEAQKLAERLVKAGIGEEWSTPSSKQTGDIPFIIKFFQIEQNQSLNLLREIKLEQNIQSAKLFALTTTLLGLCLALLLSFNLYTKVTQVRDSVYQLEKELSKFEKTSSHSLKQSEEWLRLKDVSKQLGAEMSAFQASVPSGIRTEELELTESTLYFMGSAERGIEVQELMLLLKRSGWKEVALLRFNQNTEGKVQFVLSSTRKK